MPNDNWKKQEKRNAQKGGGRRTMRSGGIWFDPGDVKLDDFLEEDKETENKSYSLKAETWRKIYKQALLNNRMPCMSIQFTNERLPNGEPIEVVVVSRDDFDSWFQKENK